MGGPCLNGGGTFDEMLLRADSMNRDNRMKDYLGWEKCGDGRALVFEVDATREKYRVIEFETKGGHFCGSSEGRYKYDGDMDLAVDYMRGRIEEVFS
ncbi:MAG: hypothetical protein KJ592_00800 [Nanoarchaeota archaeon]|nr:hypothetical protein [Nanoarchaeota archaeon]